MVGFVVSAPKTHWSRAARWTSSRLRISAAIGVFHISTLSSPGFSHQNGSLRSRNPSMASCDAPISELPSFTCLISLWVRLNSSDSIPRGCSMLRTGLGPGGFSLRGLNVSHGVATPSASKAPSLTSFMILSNMLSSSMSAGYSAWVSMATTIQPLRTR